MKNEMPRFGFGRWYGRWDIGNMDDSGRSGVGDEIDRMVVRMIRLRIGRKGNEVADQMLEN